MGTLLNKDKSAQKKRDKAEQKQQIRNAALQSFIKLPFDRVTLKAIGQRAKIRGGLASMLSGSKEELLLELTKTELERWYGALHEQLSSSDDAMSDVELADMFASSLTRQTELTRLLTLVPGVREHEDLDHYAILNLDRAHREWRHKVAAALDKRIPRFVPGDGLHFLRRVLVLVHGMEPIVRPAGVASLMLDDPDHADMKVDYRGELAAMLTMMLTGWGQQ